MNYQLHDAAATESPAQLNRLIEQLGVGQDAVCDWFFGLSATPT